MWRRSSEKWERQKSYLVRSLFENIPTLSPIVERNEPTSNVLSPARDLVSRAYSPLPELYVEKEKSRHDEPEEYYQFLEVKMIKLYRKLFYHGEYELDSDNDLTIETYVIPDYDNSSIASEQNIAADFPNCNLTSDSSDNTDFPDKPAHDEGSESVDQITIIDQYESSHISTEMSLILMPTFKQHAGISSEKDKEIIHISERLVDKQAMEEVKCSSNMEVHRIEAVRFQAIRPESCGSITEDMPNLHRDSSTPIKMIDRHMSPMRQSSSSSETYSSSDLSPESEAINHAMSDSDGSTLKRSNTSIVPEGSPNKRVKYQSHEVQTSPVRPRHWEDVRGSFFRGLPLIYSLCRCLDHECQ